MVQVLLRAITVLAALGLSAPALAYDSSWHRLEQWGGEYPSGFTMTQSRTIDLRAHPDPQVPPTIPCHFEKNATYHPWNRQRVDKHRLQFMSFTKVREFAVQSDFASVLRDEATGKEVSVSFKTGDRWRYLAYLAEGNILLEYRGSRYVGDQGMFEHSAPRQSAGEMQERGYDEWMCVSCAGGAQGWVLMREIADMPGFGPPNVLRHGLAADTRASVR